MGKKNSTSKLKVKVKIRVQFFYDRRCNTSNKNISKLYIQVFRKRIPYHSVGFIPRIPVSFNIQ